MSDSYSSSDEFIEIGISSSDCEISKNHKLLVDIEKFNGPYDIKDYDEIDVTYIYLYIDCSTIIKRTTAQAWQIIWELPIIVKLTLSSSKYVDDYNTPKVVVYQTDEKKPLLQLDNIAKKFMEEYCRIGSDTEIEIDPEYISKHEEDITTLTEIGINPSDTIRVYELHKKSLDQSIMFWLEDYPKGLLVSLHNYLCYRLPTLNKYCVLCDRTPTFIQNSSAMLKPFICGNALCYFRYEQFGIGAEFSTSLYGSNKIIYLLVAMSYYASTCKKNDLVFNPYPTIIDRYNPENIILSPDNRDPALLKSIFKGIPLKEEFYNKSDLSEFIRDMDSISPYSYTLFKWIIDSNRSYIINIPKEYQLEEMNTEDQFMLLTDSPDKEKIFQELKNKHGSIFAFHGSPFQNWHSILRNGLFNASGTKFQRNGAAHGKGIYLSPSSSGSFSYSGRASASGHICLSLCEVIDKDIKKHRSSSIWTVVDPLHVCTRFLFFYSKSTSTRGNVTKDDFLDRARHIIDNLT